MTEKLETLISSLPGWCSIKKANTLHELVKRCDAKVVVEIGCFGMRAGLALASGCRETGGQYIGIDPYSFEPSLEGRVNKDHEKFWIETNFTAIYNQAMQALAESGLIDITTVVTKRSQDAINQFTEIDVLYVDGNPSYEVTLLDIENYAPLIKKDGYLVLNNSDWSDKVRAKHRILELGFVEFLKETDLDKCEWTVYQRTGESKYSFVINAKNNISPLKINDKIEYLFTH